MPSFEEQVNQARSRVREVTPDEAKAMVDAEPGSLILDVREAHEWEQGHIAGAVHVPLGDVPARADMSSPAADPALTAHREALIVTQCATGKRSILAADLLQNLGYSKVVSMRGGFMFWARQGLPID